MTGWNVLLIDDEEDFVTTLAERLQLRGIAAQTATDGELGLRLIKNETFQVVILDVLMPDLGGMEVLKQIKAFNPHVPVILLTGHGDHQESSRGIQLGAFDYLMKPFDIDELIKKIEEAIHSQ